LHKETDTLFLCGENGLLYSIKLNTDYDPAQPAISIKPDIVKYRYVSPVNGRLGTENSIAAFKISATLLTTAELSSALTKHSVSGMDKKHNR